MALAGPNPKFTPLWPRWSPRSGGVFPCRPTACDANSAVLRARPCKMAVAADCSRQRQPGGRAGRASAEARPARSFCAAWIAGGTRGALYGPRSTAPRAAATPRSGGAYSYEIVCTMPQRELTRQIETKCAKNIPNTNKTSIGRHPMARRKFARRGYPKVEGVGVLFFVLLSAALTAAVMGGTFSCGMIGWSKYFC